MKITFNNYLGITGLIALSFSLAIVLTKNLDQALVVTTLISLGVMTVFYYLSTSIKGNDFSSETDFSMLWVCALVIILEVNISGNIYTKLSGICLFLGPHLLLTLIMDDKWPITKISDRNELTIVNYITILVALIIAVIGVYFIWIGKWGVIESAITFITS
ncbi:hypothetical protein [Thalassotalea crassostreae]|uniref:hypothetical protein n=1 Tax=Thalassotalea crassostreae TaxID=1763536 RepID=UPI000838E125|nr:hypothetical protein [Thalassotalea crassostreae]